MLCKYHYITKKNEKVGPYFCDIADFKAFWKAKGNQIKYCHVEIKNLKETWIYIDGRKWTLVK